MEDKSIYYFDSFFKMRFFFFIIVIERFFEKTCWVEFWWETLTWRKLITLVFVVFCMDLKILIDMFLISINYRQAWARKNYIFERNQFFYLKLDIIYFSLKEILNWIIFKQCPSFWRSVLTLTRFRIFSFQIILELGVKIV